MARENDPSKNPRRNIRKMSDNEINDIIDFFATDRIGRESLHHLNSTEQLTLLLGVLSEKNARSSSSVAKAALIIAIASMWITGIGAFL